MKRTQKASSVFRVTRLSFQECRAVRHAHGEARNSGGVWRRRAVGLLPSQVPERGDKVVDIGAVWYVALDVRKEGPGRSTYDPILLAGAKLADTRPAEQASIH